MKIINYTQARISLRKTLDSVIESNEPTCIVSKKNQTIIIPKKMYDDLIARVACNG